MNEFNNTNIGLEESKPVIVKEDIADVSDLDPLNSLDPFWASKKN